MWFVNFSLLSMFLTSVSAPAHRWNSYLKRGESFKHSSKSSFTVILPLSPTQNYCSNSVFWRGGVKKKKKISWILLGFFFFLRLHTGGSTHSSRRMVFPFKAYNLYSSGSSSRSPLSLLYPLSSSLLEGKPCVWSEPPPTHIRAPKKNDFDTRLWMSAWGEEARSRRDHFLFSF